MPRFDDRLKNVLALLQSGDHSSTDTIFRHICDILLQDGQSMDEERRAEVVGHLADTYGETSQATRMEMADITGRVRNAPFEIAALAAADTDVIGNRLWDRIRMPSEDWERLLPRLSRSALGRLRARLDLPDAISTSVDRQWRALIRTPGHSLPTLAETAAWLKGGTRPPEEATTPEALVPQDEVGEARSLFLSDETALVEEPQNETEDAHDEVVDLTGLLPTSEKDTEDDQSDEVESEEEVGDAVPDTESTDTDSTDTENAERENAAQIFDFAVKHLKDSEDEDEVEAEEEPEEALEIDDDAEEDTLEDKPEVDDPKIQDILQRLREFGSRSRALPPEAESEQADEEADEEAVEPDSESADVTPLFDAQAEDAQEEADTSPPAISLFTADQPEDDLEDERQEERAAGPGRARLTVEDFSPILGARWVTDRFGSIVEAGPAGAALIGAQTQAVIGDILSGLVALPGRQALDRALHARRSFRDLAAVSAADGSGWMLSGVPVFDDESGIFVGFRGTARADEAAIEPRDDDDYDAGPSNDDVFDITGLAHELRTPLNAIRGFAEMIESEQLGETSAFAQHRSQNIGLQAQKLVNVLDDLILPRADASDEDDEPTRILDAIASAIRSYEGDALIVERIAALDPRLRTPLDRDIINRVVAQLIYTAALWTGRTRPVTLSVAHGETEDADQAVFVSARTPGWTGSTSLAELDTVCRGPRLPYGHPLASAALDGRSLAAQYNELSGMKTRVAITGGAGQPMALTVSLPVLVHAPA